MGLRFYFGASDEEKSEALFQEIIERAGQDLRQNFLMLVPDQFTMQTQKRLADMHPNGGILNIDVLSFGRLGHRVLEETGGQEIPVLDDTGKCLVLQKVAASLQGELPVLGSYLGRQGYIHEVKSAISEFMQYGVGTDDLEELISYAQNRGALACKLKDLHTLYQGFLEYIRGNYITTEETLDVLRRNLHRSALVAESVVVLDGFTGFTPIQYRLIQELMRLAKETIVAITLGDKEDPYRIKGEQELFYLSKKTVADLERLAGEIGQEHDREGDVYLSGEQAGQREPALLYLQKHLFGYGYQPYPQAQDAVRIYQATDPGEEVHQTGLLLKELVLQQGFAYRDIAVVVGDLEGYAPYVETVFERLQIPCFIDRTKKIVLNPMIEFIKSGLQLFLQDFSYEAVFHYLRSGLTGMEAQDIDLLENYVLQTGIKGYSRYRKVFTHKTAQMEGEEALQHLNQLREAFLSQVETLKLKKRARAVDHVNALYDFLVANDVQQKLAQYEAFFTQEEDLARAREYAQIYRLVLELLDQIYNLLGEEPIDRREFVEILEAGFGEITVGMIPQNVDRVLVGDMERTRLGAVKVLFFLGVNDGNIPRNASKGGILSDMDREFLQESSHHLAPTPRQQMFIQRFYLYLNIGKPTQKLYVSCSRMNSEGKSIRPAYLIEDICKMFPALVIEVPQERSALEQIANLREGREYLARGLREYVQGTLPRPKERELYTLYQVYEEQDMHCGLLTGAAFYRYQKSPLSAAVADALYQRHLVNSVSRLETYAGCAYRHFLQYGLSLKEREEFGFETADLGNVYHEVLCQFAKQLEQTGQTWFTFSGEYAQQTVEKILEEVVAVYGDTILYSSERNAYMIKRMQRILCRTVLTMQKQLQRGSFLPEEYEVAFRREETLADVKIALTEQEKLYLQGRIDRVDIARDEQHVYVKVVDYKSGDKQFDLAALYYGLQLQLVVYLNAAMEKETKKYPDKEIVPAAMLYYHVDDPTVESPVFLSAGEIEAEILGMLRTKGVVNSDLTVVDKLDGMMETRSDVIPVERKKDGSLSARSSVMSAQELKTVSDYVNHRLRTMGREILDGNVAREPYERGQKQACTYCPYKRVCGFDSAIPGCERRILSELDREEIFARMEQELSGGGGE